MKVTMDSITLRDVPCGEMFVVNDTSENLKLIEEIGFCPTNPLMKIKVITTKHGTEYTAIDPNDGAPFPIPFDTKVIFKESELIVK